MIVLVKNPKDPSKSVQLSDEQVIIVYEYVVNCRNEYQGRGKPKDSVIIQMLEEAGLPVKFD
jgi:hypothetical protein